ncbi:uncharacterized protein LOC9654047 isoform X1 [Selaginella moellendorffii]|uniref:uncharacterized protein LOC9634308 isoform X1 n=1 Tax=Selaginella moellendorffii TaxID=88036 RepID=UPI000D1C692E|nr:uncharacterized protein LOC9634308 isoform X1 [Selaginella moellendorffii]XP_024543954.1 uncharacterized protein LOC9654047 isoform X1 [Selaginella moellendorffii]|eukprot:XP_024526362.1 uncharacterized protein LOC9634308 isoform X1 [Selaginella moellendorffii]
MEEAIRSMLLKLNHPGYLVDFSVEETAIFDPVTERDYFPVKIEAKKVEGFVVKGGQYFPPDEKGMRALALFLWDDDEEEDEDDIYGYHTADDMEDVCVSDVCVRYLVQKVSPEGKLLESADQISLTTDYDWRKYSCLWRESQAAMRARIMELSAKGYRIV